MPINLAKKGHLVVQDSFLNYLMEAQAPCSRDELIQGWDAFGEIIDPERNPSVSMVTN